MRRLRVHAVAWLVWFGLLWWFWMLLVAEWSTVEIVAASCVAMVGATVAEAARAKEIGALRLPWRWVWAAKSVPVAIVTDFAIVTRALVRALARRERIEGSFRVKPFSPSGPPERTRGIRAWVMLTATFSPNAYVIDFDVDHGVVLLHDLIPRDSSEAPA